MVPIPTIDKFFTGFFIILGMWAVSKYLWMCIYQIKYGDDYGEKYIKGLISKEEKQELKKHCKWRLK